MEIEGLHIARQLMRYSGQLQVYKNGKKIEIKNAREALEEDQQLISSESRELNETSKQSGASTLPTESPNERVRLGDLIRQLQEFNTSRPANEAQGRPATGTLVVEQETLTIEWEFSVSNAPVDGLVRHNKNQAETDRYQFNFRDGATLTIRDKWTNRSTTVWGDPHVDLSDMEGNANGEFSDLKGSNTHTTLMLMDGTRLTFTAKDNGIIEAVDISKGSQRLHGTGAASQNWGNPASDLFGGDVITTSSGVSSSPPLGDVVYAAGDGNDWVDASGRMVWGVTTGPVTASRPNSYQTLSYRVSATHQTSTWSG